MIIYRSRSYSVRGLLLVFGGAAATACIAYLGYYAKGAGSFIFFIGILGVVGFLILLPVSISNIFTKRPAFDFSEEGVTILDVAKERIPWDDIVGAKIQFLKGAAVVSLQVREGAAKKLKMSWLSKINRPFYGDSAFFVSPGGTTLSASELAELINRRAAFGATG